MMESIHVRTGADEDVERARRILERAEKLVELVRSWNSAPLQMLEAQVL